MVRVPEIGSSTTIEANPGPLQTGAVDRPSAPRPLCGAGVLDDQLCRHHAVPAVLLQPIGHVDLFRQQVGMIEPDGVETLMASLEAELQMLVLQQALVMD